MTTLTITKTGRVELGVPMLVSSICLRSISLYKCMYNLSEPTTYTYNGKTVEIEPGYYTYNQLLSKLPAGSFRVNRNTFKINTRGVITGGLKKFIEDDYLYLSPLYLYMYVEGLDSSQNFVNGKRSDLLKVIPVGKTNVTEVVEYQPSTEHYKAMYETVRDSLTVTIKDEWGNDYKGKFVAEITLQ